ncbi:MULTISPECIES: replicative DNA helicase [unclassified Microbacterium]|uniref:replicative DNA helicase n=1 Tax=unclassified Microbacterium TaxID=2609290 RepID=UPI00301949DC
MTSQSDLGAERSALGAMMLDARRVWDVLDVAPPADFHDPSHEIIAGAVRRLALRGEGTDPVLVEAEIAASGETLAASLGPAYLYSLTDAASTTANAGYYARLIADHATRRRLSAAGVSVVEIAADRTLTPDEQIERARAAVDSASSHTSAKVQVVGSTLDEMFARMSEPPVYTETPWQSINHLIGGLRPRAMYVVGARPASGKTIMAMNLATALADEGNVAVCSLEMGEEELQKRLVSQLGKVHMSAMSNNALDSDDWARAANARAKIMRMPLYVDDRPAQTIAQIRAHVRSVARLGPLSGVVVDYLQLVESSDPRKDRRTHLGEVSRAMKLMAKEFDCPVIALAQLNRKSEERPGKRPMLADLKETGDIEQDADVVLLLSRDLDDAARAGEVQVIVAKNRHGNTGETTLAWLGHYASMEDAGADWAP